MGIKMSDEALAWLKSVNYANRTPEERHILFEAARIIYPYKKDKK